MPIAPGTPIPTGQVHPLATLMGGGMKNFAHGASLASARMDQNSAGLTAFFADSVRQQIAMRASALEEKKFSVGTQLKKDELDWRRDESKADREQKERNMKATHGVAWARENRMKEEHDAKMERQKTIDGLMASLVAGYGSTPANTGGTGTEGTADWTQPDTQRNPSGAVYSDYPATAIRPSGSFTANPHANVSNPQWNSPQPNQPPGGTAQTPEGVINQLEQGMAAGNAEREMLGRGVSVGERKLEEGYDRMRKMRLAAIQLYAMQGNYGAAIGLRMKMEADDLERLELKHGTSEDQIETIRINDLIANGFNRYSHVFDKSDLSPQHHGEAIKELTARNTAFRLTEMPERFGLPLAVTRRSQSGLFR